ncbi:putative transcriptional regulator, CopG family [Ferroglobus placidus DSM 10642]|uniref:Putative transcriptional regulator, CopG family n=1 Tax=Ferroglobus placidus (strain DSM 10642 / AEDII12DO) TaxID=589924 RepID=D3RXA2_FERPA|nr:ribbon-helix-helix domain-containing protein [Ferroglobus placidus]ADC65115.1 putative transcriptional regulator, CopG family [Ferroglobus placidus DSM 10642]
MRIVNLRLEDKIVEKLDEISSKFLISRSELIRQAIVMYLSALENLGFYFKPSVLLPKLDVYEERNSISIDFGNFTSLTVLSFSYAGVGEKERDLKVELERVAEILANQVKVESLTRFVEPFVGLLSTGNDIEYSLRFFRLLKNFLNFRLIIASSENVMETKESFFSLTVVGMRDMKVRNSPKRGEKIFLYGKILKEKELVKERGIDVKLVEKLVEFVKNGKASSIFAVKSDGLLQTCSMAASLAGGKLVMKKRDEKGCPATAVIVTAEEMPLPGGIEVGEIV